MTTTDAVVNDRRSRRRPSRQDSRLEGAGHSEPAAERQQLHLSLSTVGCVALTLLFLRLGMPGPAFVLLAVGALLLSRSRSG